jgi:hypothetical protein
MPSAVWPLGVATRSWPLESPLEPVGGARRFPPHNSQSASALGESCECLRCRVHRLWPPLTAQGSGWARHQSHDDRTELWRSYWLPE